MPTYKTPDVYVEELALFPPSVAEVGTAIPAFIGYTEKAKRIKDDDLRNKPTQIFSLTEYEQYYGSAQPEPLQVTVNPGDPAKNEPPSAEVADINVTYLLYYSVKLYFANGGSQCYIVSVGGYKAAPAPAVPPAAPAADIRIELDPLKTGLDRVAGEDEPTLIVIPEAVKLSEADYTTLVQAVLEQCGKLKDRFGIFDLMDGGTGAVLDAAGLDKNRKPFATNLKYGAAYYPFIRTAYNYRVLLDETNVKVKVGGADKVLKDIAASDTVSYNLAKAALRDKFVITPPSGAVAGVYAAIDSARGVWKAPANVALANVIEPVVRLDSLRQEPFNVDSTTGKSINVLRAFAGKGTVVWGARTLAGNDNEWRYVSVRRFFNMVEESVKKSTYWAVFEPNDANTWVKVRGMIESYLTDKWREGALAGAAPKDAFFVRCGLGTTMNAQDILEGRMNVEIGMAAVRPAEFIILKFSHKMQTS
jgi:phage tail sheath protein FI